MDIFAVFARGCLFACCFCSRVVLLDLGECSCAVDMTIEWKLLSNKGSISSLHAKVLPTKGCQASHGKLKKLALMKGSHPPRSCMHIHTGAASNDKMLKTRAKKNPSEVFKKKSLDRDKL